MEVLEDKSVVVLDLMVRFQTHKGKHFGLRIYILNNT